MSETRSIALDEETYASAVERVKCIVSLQAEIDRLTMQKHLIEEGMTLWLAYSFQLDPETTQVHLDLPARTLRCRTIVEDSSSASSHTS